VKNAGAPVLPEKPARKKKRTNKRGRTIIAESQTTKEKLEIGTKNGRGNLVTKARELLAHFNHTAEGKTQKRKNQLSAEKSIEGKWRGFSLRIQKHRNVGGNLAKGFEKHEKLRWNKGEGGFDWKGIRDKST